ncbi:MAG: DUF3305 domain-containing protein [Sedimenticola sp.]|nr:DUF3305 domain-containing protein [Sedimenticola sp.]
MFQEPVEDLDAKVPAEFLISVIMQSAPSNNPWLDTSWEAVGVTAQLWDGAIPKRQVSLIHEQEETKQYLNSGFQLQLYADECESYYQNLCSPSPSCFVIAHDKGDGSPIPFLVSLSFDAANAYQEGDEIVYAVAMPPELYRWCELFVLNHYVPEQKKKRRLKDWRKKAADGGERA